MIKKAVITAAGKGTRQYPGTNAVQKELFPLVDRDGMSKPTIQIIVEEALNAGIEDIAIIVQPGEEVQFKNHFRGLTKPERASFANKPWGMKQSDLLEKAQSAITYIHQTVQEGFGHAVYCAREWVGADPFLLMLGDHIYISNKNESCAEQLVSGFEQFGKSIYGVKRTPAELIYLFGTLTGEKIQENPAAYRVSRIVEKPAVSYARENLMTDGLPEDTFLTFFGMHVFTPEIFNVLEEHIRKNIREKNEIQLTSAQEVLCQREGVVALEIDGMRLDMGTPLGYLETQMALALHGPFRHDVELIFKRLEG